MPRDPLLNDVGYGDPRVARRLVRGRQGPSRCKSKLAMDAVTGRAGKEPQLHERPAQHLLRQHALQYLGPARVHIGRGWRIGRYPLGTLEVVVVMAAAAAKRQRQRHRRSPPAGPPDALLVVEAHRRHVGHHDRKQRTDVNASFHRRRHAEQVDVVRDGVLITDSDVLEKALPVSCQKLVSLTGQLCAVEPEN